MASLIADTKVQATSSHTYTANFPDQWCIGSVPHGGFVASTFQRVASMHFATTLSKQNQPHTMTMHLSYVRRTNIGPATFTVKDVKLGRATSIVHVTLTQNGREEVVGYITHTNLKTENGVSYPTSWSLHPAPAPRPATPASFIALKEGKDKHWLELAALVDPKFRKAGANVTTFLPRAGQPGASIADELITLKSGERFTNDTLGFVVDLFPQIIEVYRKQEKAKGVQWYPTVLLNLDVKKALPEEGVEWLFVRTRAKMIQNGRYDLEVVVEDEEGDLVAISHHVVMIRDSARNLAKRRTGVDGEGSKL